MVPADQELQLCGPIHAGWPLRIPGAEERAERSRAARSSRPDENATCALLLFGGSARHPQSPVEAVGRAVMSQPYASPVGIASFKTRPPSVDSSNRCARRGAPELESRLSLMNGIGFEPRRARRAPRDPEAGAPSRSGRNLSASSSTLERLTSPPRDRWREAIVRAQESAVCHTQPVLSSVDGQQREQG